MRAESIICIKLRSAVTAVSYFLAVKGQRLSAVTAEKCFGPISNFAIYGDKVALVTGEMTEKDAATLCTKLNGCKAYRLL